MQKEGRFGFLSLNEYLDAAVDEAVGENGESDSDSPCDSAFTPKAKEGLNEALKP